MIKAVLRIKRADIWDTGGTGGLLKGQLFQALLERELSVQTIEDCPYPLGVTTFCLGKFRTNHITKGHLATAMRASCTFPGLFEPVKIGGRPNIDGGVFDNVGLMALPHALGLDDNVHHCDHPSLQEMPSRKDNLANPDSTSTRTTNKNRKTSSASTNDSNRQGMHLVVNIVFGKASMSSSVLPPSLTNHKVADATSLTLVTSVLANMLHFLVHTAADGGGRGSSPCPSLQHGHHGHRGIQVSLSLYLCLPVAPLSLRWKCTVWCFINLVCTNVPNININIFSV